MKKTLFFVLLCLLVLALVACGEVTFGELTINVSDVSDVPEGEYTMRYSVSGYEAFLSSHPTLNLSVTVVDEQNNVVDVRNNRVIVVEKGKTYTANVALTYVEGEKVYDKNKQFVITAERIPPKVTFSVGGRTLREFTLPYNGTLAEEEISSIINRDYSDLTVYPESGLSEGIVYTVVSQQWVVGSPTSDVAYTRAAVTEVKKDVAIYLKRTFRSEGRKKVTMTFHNDGGSETADVTVDYGMSVLLPASPTKAGFVFDGWYADRALTEKYTWNIQSHYSDALTKDCDLYAKWVSKNNGADESQFSYDVRGENGYTLYDNDGYAYCLVKAKDGVDYAGAMILPVGYGNVPVKGFADRAFENCNMTAVTIPAGYNNNNYYAFCGCASLQTVTFENGSEQTFLSNAVFKDCVSLQSVILPAKIKTTGVSVFENCAALSSVVLPEGMTVINEKCFKNCTSLTSVAVPDSVTTINDHAFSGCENLSTLTFSASSKLNTIYATSLEGTAIESIILPSYFAESERYPFSGTTINVTYYPAPTE